MAQGRTDDEGARPYVASEHRAESRTASDWASGGVAFAAAMLLMIGTFHLIAGLVAIVNSEFFTAVRAYTYDLDLRAWGWMHVVFGVIAVAAGVSLFSRARWAEAFALVVAWFSAIDNFFFIPYAPFWALLLIALDVWVIWSLTRPRHLARHADTGP